MLFEGPYRTLLSPPPVVSGGQGGGGGGALILPSGRQMLDTSSSLASGVVAFAYAREDGSYDSIGPTFAGNAILQNPHTFNGSNTLVSQTPDNASTFGTALKWQGDTWELQQAGWWFDVDKGGELNPVQQAMWLDNQVGAGFSMSVLFYQSGDSGDSGTNPICLFGRGANLDTFASAGGIFLQGSAGSYNIRGEVYQRPSGAGSEVARVIGSAVACAMNALHLAVLTVVNDSAQSATAKFYLDGVLKGTVSGLDVISAGDNGSINSGVQIRNSTTNNTEAQLQLGGFYHEFGGNGNFGYVLKGYVFEAILHGRGLSATDVTNMWAAPHSMVKAYSAPAANTWTPATEGVNCVGHWNALTGVSQTSGAVTAVADQSSAGNNLAAAGTAGAVQYSATGFNGNKPGFTLNKATAVGSLTGAIPQLDGTKPCSVFMTVKCPFTVTGLADGDGFLGLLANGAAHDYSDAGSFGLHFTTEGRNTMNALSSFTALGPATGVPMDPFLPFTVGVIFDGTNAALYLNGCLANNTTAWEKMGAVGGSVLNLFFAYTGNASCSIADVAVFKNVIDPTNYEAYAETTFGVPMTNTTQVIRCA